MSASFIELAPIPATPALAGHPLTVDHLAATRMRERGGTWYAYQCSDAGSGNAGHMSFLACGPDHTHPVPPATFPDSIRADYVLVGRVELVSATVERF